MMTKGERRIWPERLFHGVCLFAVTFPLVILLLLLVKVGLDGFARIDMDFITNFPSRRAAKAGILPAMVGSFYLITLTTLIAVPVGIGAAIYLQEYGRNSRWSNLIEVNIANLAGVPSIIYGLLGLGVFVRTRGMGRSLLAGACTLALLILPIIIMAAREALRTVPNITREAAYGLGATQWQVTRRVVLPVALPGMMTGQILAGVDPVEAVKYQLMVSFLIAGGTGIGVLAAVLGGAWRITDSRHRLRLDRLAAPPG